MFQSVTTFALWFDSFKPGIDTEFYFSESKFSIGVKMFVGREKELGVLTAQFASRSRTAVLVYGKRRVGKSTLISQAAKEFDGTVVEHVCAQSSFEGNLELLCRSVGKSLGTPTLRFEHLFDRAHYETLETLPRISVSPWRRNVTVATR